MAKNRKGKRKQGKGKGGFIETKFERISLFGAEGGKNGK